ncbi:hypothetical protein CVU75_00015 [Candidatus Dependentiae bacterium HGW-Dependentiae-1]|nr:MAG: hypothetical protein CVU75_00015 [Candidatus Dependentiae bacterium HGW-Dependentiae-1]
MSTLSTLRELCLYAHHSLIKQSANRTSRIKTRVITNQTPFLLSFFFPIRFFITYLYKVLENHPNLLSKDSKRGMQRRAVLSHTLF